jgi:hypothetical protein
MIQNLLLNVSEKTKVKVNSKKALRNQNHAGVAKPGQRRRLQEPIPQGFVGSNPTPRTIYEGFVI